jgi:hypothetical protein
MAIVSPEAAYVLDLNQDGVVSAEEVNGLVLKSELASMENKLLKSFIKALTTVVIILIASIAVITYGIVASSIEVKSSDGKMVDPQGNEIQCASSDLSVTSDGTLISRSGDHSSTSRRALTSQDQGNSDITNALGVRNYYTKVKLHSSLPDQYFREMSWLNLESSTAATLSLKVSGIIRIPHNKARCGSYLKITTGDGVLLLDDEYIYYDHDVYSSFAQSGWESFSAQEAKTQRRILHHLSSSHHTLDDTKGFRKLTATDIGIVGFFNSIDNYEWICQSVEKPELPSYFSAEMSYYLPCRDPSQEISYDRCSFTLGASSKLL